MQFTIYHFYIDQPQYVKFMIIIKFKVGGSNIFKSTGAQVHTHQTLTYTNAQRKALISYEPEGYADNS